MEQREYLEKLREYDFYIKQKMLEARSSLNGFFAEESKTEILKSAREKLFEVFPEIKPRGYSTIAEEVLERKSEYGKIPNQRVGKKRKSKR